MTRLEQAPEATGTPQKAPAVGSQVDLVLGPLAEVLACWEDQNGAMAAILPSEWEALKQDVMDACVVQSPRMLRAEILRLRTACNDRTDLLRKQAEELAGLQDALTDNECLRAAINEAMPFTMTAGQQILTAALGPNVRGNLAETAWKEP